MFGRNRKKRVRAMYWKDDSGFEYPESSLESLAEKEDFGLAFSGGGTRAASATLGQLRALRATGLLDKAKYISTVSGGTWAAAPFVFLPETHSEEEFLGEEQAPEEITLPRLKEISKRSLAHAISDSVIIDDLLEHAFRFAGDETFSRAIGNLFLEPFGLGGDRRFVTQDQKSLSAILGRNKKIPSRKCYLEEGDFYRPRQNMPFLIMNGTILNGFLSTKKFPFEMTPLYVGTRQYFSSSDSVGGGFVEPLGYDSSRRSKNGQILTLKLGSRKHVFSLSDMIGTSGAAPQELLYKLHLRSVGLPEFRHWAIHPGGGFGDDEELSHGDGGHLDNLGIMPLLARGVRKIIVFVNSKTEFVHHQDLDRVKMASSIGNLFRRHPEDDFATNIVFDDPDQERLGELVDGFEACKMAGRPLIWQAEYDVFDNPTYSIDAYGPVKISWVYNQNVADWRALIEDYQVRKAFDTKELGSFPHYATFFENVGRVIDLSKVQTGLLAHMCCWSVRQSEASIRQFLDIA